MLFGVSVASLPRSFSLKDIRYGSSLAKPQGLTLYRFQGAYNDSSVACPDEHYQPPDDPDAAAESAAEKVCSMRLPPFLHDDESFKKGRVERAQPEARRGTCKWQVISAKQVEDLIHKGQSAASTLDEKVADSDDSGDDAPGACEHAVIGCWLASLNGDGIIKLGASFRQHLSVVASCKHSRVRPTTIMHPWATALPAEQGTIPTVQCRVQLA